MTERSQPIETIRIGGVKAVIWENIGEGNRKFHTTSISRSYMGDDGAWNETNTYLPDQLPKLELAVRKAFEFTQLHGRSASRENRFS